MNRTFHRLEMIAANLSPPFADPDAINALIELADGLSGDPDIEDHPTEGEHDGCEPDDDREPWLGWANPGGDAPMPEGWSPTDLAEWTLNCDMLHFDGSGGPIGRRLLRGICEANGFPVYHQ